jgi:hypothetical protein
MIIFWSTVTFFWFEQWLKKISARWTMMLRRSAEILAKIAALLTIFLFYGLFWDLAPNVKAGRKRELRSFSQSACEADVSTLEVVYPKAVNEAKGTWYRLGSGSLRVAYPYKENISMVPGYELRTFLDADPAVFQVFPAQLRGFFVFYWNFTYQSIDNDDTYRLMPKLRRLVKAAQSYVAAKSEFVCERTAQFSCPRSVA